MVYHKVIILKYITYIFMTTILAKFGANTFACIYFHSWINACGDNREIEEAVINNMSKGIYLAHPNRAKLNRPDNCYKK